MTTFKELSGWERAIVVVYGLCLCVLSFSVAYCALSCVLKDFL